MTGVANTENCKGEVVPVHTMKAYRRSNGIAPLILNINTVVLFQDAKRDETARKAYKLLATLHSDCSDLVQMVEETGATVREIRDLEEQVMSTILGFGRTSDVSLTKIWKERLYEPYQHLQGQMMSPILGFTCGEAGVRGWSADSL